MEEVSSLTHAQDDYIYDYIYEGPYNNTIREKVMEGLIFPLTYWPVFCPTGSSATSLVFFSLEKLYRVPIKEQILSKKDKHGTGT